MRFFNRMMSSKKRINQTLFRNAVIIIILTVIAIGSFWIWDIFTRSNLMISKMETQLTQERKQVLVDQVDRAISFIEFEKSRLSEKTQKIIKDQVYSAHAIAVTIYETYKNTKSRREIEILIREVLRPIRFNNGKGYFFATGFDGVEQLFADKPELEGKNLLNLQDTKGAFVIQDMIDIAAAKGEGFYSYSWSKPASDRKDHIKISFIKHFKPFDWFIGTGLYQDELEKQAQEAAIKRIDSIKFGKGGYIFAGQWDGWSLTHPAKGKNMIHVTDPNGVKIVEDLINLSKGKGGFVQYVMPKLAEEKPLPKISFARGVHDWEWYVGAGVYVDDIEQAILQARQNMMADIKTSILKVVAVLVLITLLALWAAERTSRQLQNALDNFSSFFKHAAGESTEINPDNMQFEEFKELATETNLMLKQIKDAENKVNAMAKNLRQAQKMEAIGTLAGGIAHDFNNILGAIYGYCQLARMHVESGDTLQIENDIAEIRKGAGRATELVKQILTFSRKTKFEQHPLKISLIIKEALKLLRSSIPTTIEIKQNINSKSMVIADPTQIHQVTMNLCTNAYHAMKETGGLLTIILEDMTVAKGNDFPPDQHMTTGEYIMLKVSDTGSGMDRETLEKIFDPYFTTKEVGEGTGLGLSVVHGIISNLNGYIDVDSKPDKGTEFTVLFPVAPKKNESIETEKLEKDSTGGSERILFVDDEEKICAVNKQILHRLGYSVDAFTNPEDALNTLIKEPGGYDLVVTDMTMPKMTGRELALKIMDVRSDMPIILCTGYTSLISKEEALKIGIKDFCEKPVTSNQIAKVIRRVLDSM